MSKYNWDVYLIRLFVKESISFTEVLNKLKIPKQGNNIGTLKRILNNYNIDYSHFTGRSKTYSSNYILANEYLNDYKQISTSSLKEKLLKENLIENKCAICGLTEWLGKPIVLQLHHIDGNNKNNHLKNLQLLCPNCHSQTDNYCGNANSDKTKYYCKDCGKEISKRSTYCTLCSRLHSRKIKDRPSLNQLLNDYKELKSFLKIAKKYGISDNGLRKWLKQYNVPSKTKELDKYIKENNI